MKYSTFREQVENRPYFSSQLFSALTNEPQLLRVQMQGWIKRGDIWPLKRGLYTLNTRDRQIELTPFALANVLYTPSYISLATAMSYYQMIPERVKTISSLSTKKTQTFSNEIGHFTYQHIQIHCFQGVVQREDEFGLPYMIATPEKAIVDFLYFQLRSIKQFDEDWFSDSLRLQNIEQLHFNQVKHFAKAFKNKRLLNCVNMLEHYND